MRLAIARTVRKQIRRLIRPIIEREPNLAAKIFAYRSEHKDFLIERPKRDETDNLPLPPPELWIATGPGGYGDSEEEYLRLGRQHVATMLGLLDRTGVSLRSGGNVLDLGCSSGRMIRWFADQAESGEVWGVDISAEHIVWCQQHLSPPFHFCTTTTIPHLPFEDRYFELIYAGSVFTHLGELADAWLLELKRLLAPGGRLYITVNDKQAVEIARRNPEFNLAKQFEDARDRIPIDKVDYAVASIFRSYTLYDREYLLGKLSRWFEVIAVEEQAYGVQTGILLRKG